MTFTLDVNVLLYAADTLSPHHRPARDLVERLAAGPEIAYLFWPTLVGFVRMATHPAILVEPLSVADALANVEQLLDRPHVKAPGEQESFWRHFSDVAVDARPSGNLVADAHLVALMRENGVRTIWTHDRDFHRFSGIEVRDPFAAGKKGGAAD